MTQTNNNKKYTKSKWQDIGIKSSANWNIKGADEK